VGVILDATTHGQPEVRPHARPCSTYVPTVLATTGCYFILYYSITVSVDGCIIYAVLVRSARLLIEPCPGCPVVIEVRYTLL